MLSGLGVCPDFGARPPCGGGAGPVGLLCLSSILLLAIGRRLKRFD
jgi:hypothetical protein